jgi:cytochrome c biogenesis protein CcmG/thiol:disulfide interchange protein DsbE
VVALLAYGLTTQAPDSTIDDALAEGRATPAPRFVLDVLTAGDLGRASPTWWRAARDRRVSLSELRGTTLVINFWASWCPPCRDEAPVLEQAWRQSDRDVLVLGVNQQDAREAARGFIREFSLSFPHLREAGKETAQGWGVTGLPETFFVSPEGNIVSHVIGVVSPRQMTSGIAAAQAGRPGGAQAGGDRQAID